MISFYNNRLTKTELVYSLMDYVCRIFHTFCFCPVHETPAECVFQIAVLIRIPF